jgi:Flp pilus assembly protein TadD
MTEAEVPLEELRSIPAPPAADAPRRSSVPPPVITPVPRATAPILTNDAEVPLEELLADEVSTVLESSSNEDITAPLRPISTTAEDNPMADLPREDVTAPFRPVSAAPQDHRTAEAPDADITAQLRLVSATAEDNPMADVSREETTAPSQPASVAIEDHPTAASAMEDEATQVLSHHRDISNRDAALSQQYLAQTHVSEAPEGDTHAVADSRNIDDFNCAPEAGAAASLDESTEQATIPLDRFAREANGAAMAGVDQPLHLRAVGRASPSGLIETTPIAVADAPSFISDSDGTQLIPTRRWILPRKVGVLALTTVAAAMVVYGTLRWSEPKKVTVVGSVKPVASIPSKFVSPAKPQVVEPKAPEPAAAAGVDTPQVATAAVDAAAVALDMAEEQKAPSIAAEEKRGTKTHKSAHGRGISKLSSGASLAKRTSKVEAIKEKARAHFQARRYSAAAAAYKEATRLDPSNAGSYAGLGASLTAIHDSDGAIAAYQRAIQLSPKSSGYHAALGRTYYSKGDKARAIKAYKKAVEIDPNNRLAQSALKRLAR